MTTSAIAAGTLVLGLALAAQAQAHIVFTQAEAEPKAYYAAALRVSHGCDGSPTRSVMVTIPSGVVTAKPRPKPGWTLEIEREPLAVPVKGEGGKTIRERVKSITWKGLLPDDQFDDFGLMAQLPDLTGPLYFPTVQGCDAGQNRWTDIPAAGQPWHSVPHPAPVVLVKAPALDHAAMPGMDMHGH